MFTVQIVFIQCMQSALEKMKDEKFQTAAHFTLEEISEPVPKKILNSVMWSFAKILTTFCPHQEKSGPAVYRYISDHFDPWFSHNFPLLSSSPATTRTYKSRIHGWFLTILKRKKPKGKKPPKDNRWLSEWLFLMINIKWKWEFSVPLEKQIRKEGGGSFWI